MSLQIARGETFGLIGPNGCGKSTLLQIVAGILEPDEGSVTATGRITSLLELGAGFSPDLTGRENIFLNASLYGVSRDFIARRFDEIVAFSELERFIDMPVRTYSSGMYVRLGFAVAVHLDPEVILVDEAFAVGDERFQRKCLHTIRDFQKRGTTLVMVSHDLLLIEHLCTRAALLEQGTLAAVGAPADVIGHYHALNTGRDLGGTGHRWGTGAIQITHVELFSGDRRLDAASPTVSTRDALRVRVHYTCPEPVDRPVFGLAIHRDDGVHVTGPNTHMAGIDMGTVAGEGDDRLHDRAAAAAARTLLPDGRGLRSRTDHAVRSPRSLRAARGRRRRHARTLRRRRTAGRVVGRRRSADSRIGERHGR